MSEINDVGKRHCVRAEQKFDAKQMIVCGCACRNVARHCRFLESELRCQLGLPPCKHRPAQNRQQRSFGCEVSR